MKSLFKISTVAGAFIFSMVAISPLAAKGILKHSQNVYGDVCKTLPNGDISYKLKESDKTWTKMTKDDALRGNYRCVEGVFYFTSPEIDKDRQNDAKDAKPALAPR